MNKDAPPSPISPDRTDALYLRLDKEAKESGYNLNPDVEFTRDLVEGLLINEDRYGYWNCPCRRATGDRQKDLDIICPCDYRDADVNEYGACFCALYVSDAIAKGLEQAKPIPERRPKDPAKRGKPASAAPAASNSRPAGLSVPVWRCKVCGYLCGRENPPEKCPICKVSKDRFERFMG
jgi:ferredoxin-thioredoxin reductase catalytic chain